MKTIQGFIFVALIAILFGAIDMKTGFIQEYHRLLFFIMLGWICGDVWDRIKDSKLFK